MLKQIQWLSYQLTLQLFHKDTTAGGNEAGGTSPPLSQQTQLSWGWPSSTHALILEHMAEKPNGDLPVGSPDRISGGFLQKGGNSGRGMQLRVQPDEMEKAPTETSPKGTGKGRRTKLAAFGLSPSIIKEGDPEYSVCLYQADKYRRTRMKELQALHGHVSSGAGALLASASLALACSRYLFQRAATDGDAATIKMGSQLADSARSNELAAWELAAREGILKRRQEAASTGTPWLQMDTGKAKPGRKTNEQRAAVVQDAVVVASPSEE